MSRAGRRAVVAGGVFVVAAVGGVVGNQIKGWGWAITAFGVLTVVGGGLAAWLDRLSDDEEATRPAAEPTAGTSATSVAVENGQGIQIGDHNRQVNRWGPTVLNPRAGRDVNVADTINVDNRRGRTDKPAP